MRSLITQINIAPDGGFQGFGPLGLEGGNSSSAVEVFTTFLSSTIGLLTLIAIIWFVFLFITGAIALMGSGGDKNAMEAAKKKITTGIIGLVIVIISMFIFDLIGNLLGIKDIRIFSVLFDSIIGNTNVGG